VALRLARLDQPYTEPSRALIDDSGAYLAGFLIEVIELPVDGGRTVTELTTQSPRVWRGGSERLRKDCAGNVREGGTVGRRGAAWGGVPGRTCGDPGVSAAVTGRRVRRVGAGFRADQSRDGKLEIWKADHRPNSPGFQVFRISPTPTPRNPAEWVWAGAGDVECLEYAWTRLG